MASLKNIAAELGISYTLVSKVLSGRMGTTGVSEATRAAIIKKAAELDYQPNAAAVALKTGRKGVVALFLHRMGVPGSELSQKFITSTAEGFSSAGQRLWLRFFYEDEDFSAACDSKLSRSVDGLIVAGVRHPRLIRKLHEIEQGGLPVITAFADFERKKDSLTSDIVVDSEMQCYLTTRLLLSKGCRRLAHFRVFEARYQGFVRAHQEMSVPVCRSLVIRPDRVHDFAIASGERGTRLLLSKKQQFDGIVTQSDAQAIGALRVLYEHGIRVPDDVKLTGVDDSPLAEACLVPLTSSSSEIEECGRLAVSMLLDKIDGKKVRPVILSPRLVVRESAR